MFVEKRRLPRRLVHIPAKFATSDSAPLRDCIVVDISDYGARLELDNPNDVPERFTVVMGPNGGPYRRCRVVWRANNQMGVEFDRDSSSHACQEGAPVVHW
jgi:PilZ domain